MGYKITSGYRWYTVPKEPSSIAKVYYIEGIPFTFDIIDDIENENTEILKEANTNKALKAEDMFKKSDYLIAEMMHPLLFDLEIDNPELLPSG